jgi:hypothetical protein
LLVIRVKVVHGAGRTNRRDEKSNSTRGREMTGSDSRRPRTGPIWSALKGPALGLLPLTVASAVTAILAGPAYAQSASSETALRDFDVPATTLGTALLRFGEQSGLQFSVSSSLTSGKSTSGIKGKYTPEDGLRTLLSGSGLTFRFTGSRTVVIEKLPNTGDARVLGPLRVEGAGGTNATAGANGSSDPTATQGTGSLHQIQTRVSRAE